MLNSSNVIARLINNNLFEIEYCHIFKEDEYEILRNTTHHLHWEWGNAVKENCAETILLSLHSKIVQYNRATGNLKGDKYKIMKTTTDLDEWDFLYDTKETVLKDIFIHQSHELQEEIIKELEISTEKFTETLTLD